MEQAPIPGARTIALHIPYNPHISVLCTVCHREVWVSVKFTKNLPKILNTTKENTQAIQFEWIGTIPTKYQALEEDFDGKSPSLLQQLLHVCQVGHTIDTYCITVSQANKI